MLKVEYSAEEDLADSQVIVAQSFGVRAMGFSPSNNAIAAIVRWYHVRFKIPFILQQEIANCLPDLSPFRVIAKHRKPGKYLDSWEVIAQSAEICGENGWEKTIIACHKDHAYRVKTIAENLGLSARIPADVKRVPYDRKSLQRWTRSKFLFLPREIPLRIIATLQGFAPKRVI
jgi:hypothetical protein